MDSVELVLQICKERGIPISKLERDCGFSNGYIKKLKEGKFPSDRLQKIADYLNIDIATLLGLDKQISFERTYYFNEETAKLAQKMFEDKDMQSLYHIKTKMDPKKFEAYMNFIKAQFKLEHPEE
jgi:transcriptional regulator with XRE-family HTH domain